MEKRFLRRLKCNFSFRYYRLLSVKLPICAISTDITINTPSMCVQDLGFAYSLGKCFYVWITYRYRERDQNICESGHVLLLNAWWKCWQYWSFELVDKGRRL